MLLKLPASLHYPITVTELLKQSDDDVARFAPLLSYTYQTTVTETDELGTERRVEKTFPAEHKSEVEGVLKSWKIKKGTIVSHANVEIVEIQEPCDHSVQFGGMCALCFKNMTETTYVTEELESSRATVNMAHNNVLLKVSQDEATRVEDEAKRRLIAAKKLSLVVDLDQTIIHATVDPTVGDWQRDEDNPNYPAVKDVRSFLLKDDGPANRGCWYYVKLRPGLEDFLENVSKLYELHIYTMGTRQYAKNIADIIDPEHKIFGDRILSRDESGSLTAKNLQRLFPVDTKMVVIIDDRGDVWKWSPNLIKVVPYDFFVGIGDINSSFLPKKPNIKDFPKPELAKTSDTDGKTVDGDSQVAETSTNGVATTDAPGINKPDNDPLVDEEASPLQQVVAMAGGLEADSSALSTQQDEAIASQLEDRPLLQKQKQLEEEEEALPSNEAVSPESGGEQSADSELATELERPKHNLLRDDDQELNQLESSLRAVHSAFYEAYSQNLAGAQGGRLGQLRGSKKPKLRPETSDLDLIPDIKIVMPAIKSRVLGGTVIVFSGIVPLGMDIASSEPAIQATSFGARIDEEVTKHTTHLVAARNRTQKVQVAARKRRGAIKIVGPSWLFDSMTTWSRRDETPYLLDVKEPKNGHVDEEDDMWSESEAPADEESSSDTDTPDVDDGKHTARRPTRLKLNTKPPPGDRGDTPSDVEGAADFEYDDKSPVGGTNEDWSAMNDELKDFLGSEAESSDDDNDSVTSDRSLTLRGGGHGKKRSREEYESGPEDGDETALDRKLPKKQNGQTSLSQSTLADNDDVEEEQMENIPNGAEVDVDEGEEPAKEGDGWSDFDDEEFEAEFQEANSDGQEEVSPA